MFWYIYYFLNIIILITGFLMIFSNSIMNLLLFITMMIFLQGIMLLLLNCNMISLYLMIIYIGAMVILFSFMILFMNWEETMKFKFKHYKNMFFMMNLLMIHMFMMILWQNNNMFIMNLKKKIISNMNEDCMEMISLNLFNKFLLPLILVIFLLMMGLLLVMKLMMNKKM